MLVIKRTLVLSSKINNSKYYRVMNSEDLNIKENLEE